jgi:protein O-mannosyl-transferase
MTDGGSLELHTTSADRQDSLIISGTQMDQTQPEATASQFRHVLFILLITFLVYVQSLSFPFLQFDDTTFIVENPRMHEWAALPSYFSGGNGNSVADKTTIIPGFYRPIQNCWVLLSYKILGLHPGLWHLVGVLLYGLGIGLLWKIIKNLTGDEFVASGATLLYALHPMHVEGVAWISAAWVDPLVSIFFFAGFLAWLRWRNGNGYWWLALCGVLTLGALLSKETGIALPALIILHALIFRKSGDGSRRSWRNISALIVVMTMSVATYAAMRLHATGAFITPDPAHTWNEVLRTAPLMFVTYLGHAVWPVHLGTWYDVSVVAAVTEMRFWFPLIILAGYIVLTIWAVIRKPLWGFFLLWWLVPLGAPVIGGRNFNDYELLHDRFAFVPIAGLCVILVTWLGRIPARQAKLFGMNAVSAGGIACLVTLMGIKTAAQAGTWKNDQAMFTQAVQACPGCVRPRLLLANWFARQGDIGKALELDREAIQVLPNRWEPSFVYGITLARTGDRGNALRSLAHALELGPGETSIYLGTADVLAQDGRFAEAVQVLQRGEQRAGNPQLIRQWLLNMEKFRRLSEAARQAK